MLHFLYVDKYTAKEYGATHEGYFFWTPAYFVGDPDNEDNVFNAMSKSAIFQVWWWIADKFCDLATYFMREDQYFEIPLKVTGKL